MMTLLVGLAAGFCFGWQAKFRAVRRELPFVIRQHTAWSRDWWRRHGC